MVTIPRGYSNRHIAVIVPEIITNQCRIGQRIDIQTYTVLVTQHFNDAMVTFIRQLVLVISRSWGMERIYRHEAWGHAASQVLRCLAATSWMGVVWFMVKGVLQLRRESFSPGKLNAASQGNLLACQFFTNWLQVSSFPGPPKESLGRRIGYKLNIKLDVIWTIASVTLKAYSMWCYTH